ncbi:MAG TPA: transferase hexapeptide repeat family protein [Bacteroidia bacterium]|nr:transferase hexapeptide repeat family protein [Bacteroidia bacterium]
MIYKFKKYIPVIHPSSFIHPLASVTGNVTIGKNVFVGSGAALRGDIGEIIIEDGCNIQENCIIHMFPGATVHLKKGSHIGHGAIVHGAQIGENVLIGMSSVIMDNVEIGDNCIIGALSLITEGNKIPERKVVVGNPAKIIKEVSDEMLKWKTEGTKIYVRLTADCLTSMKEVKPLKKEGKKTKQASSYKTWKNTKK